MPWIQAQIGAPVGHAFDFQFLVSPLAFTFSFLTQPLAQDSCEQITFLPTLTAPNLSFSFLSVSLFLCTLGNDNQLLATATWHQYAPEHSLIHFSLFLLTFLLLFSCMFGTMMMHLPTYPQYCSSKRTIEFAILLVSFGILTCRQRWRTSWTLCALSTSLLPSPWPHSLPSRLVL